MEQRDEFAEVDTTEDEFDAMWTDGVPVSGTQTHRAGHYWKLVALTGTAVSGSRVAGREFSLTSRTQQSTAPSHL